MLKIDVKTLIILLTTQVFNKVLFHVNLKIGHGCRITNLSLCTRIA
jgi:hypothetical protein